MMSEFISIIASLIIVAWTFVIPIMVFAHKKDIKLFLNRLKPCWKLIFGFILFLIYGPIVWGITLILWILSMWDKLNLKNIFFEDKEDPQELVRQIIESEEAEEEFDATMIQQALQEAASEEPWQETHRGAREAVYYASDDDWLYGEPVALLDRMLRIDPVETKIESAPELEGRNIRV